MGIRHKPIAPASPWQNGFAERLIGSIRRECGDHFIVLGEAHLRHILPICACHYNDIRTHRSSDKDAPVCRAINELASSVHARSLADFITITCGFRFSVHTADPKSCRRLLSAETRAPRRGRKYRIAGCLASFIPAPFKHPHGRDDLLAPPLSRQHARRGATGWPNRGLSWRSHQGCCLSAMRWPR
jgi:hypothetical protein